MRTLTSLVFFSAQLLLASAANTNYCPANDETSLVQVKTIFKAGTHAYSPQSQTAEVVKARTSVYALSQEEEDEINSKSEEELDALAAELLRAQGEEESSEADLEDNVETDENAEVTTESEAVNVETDENAKQDIESEAVEMVAKELKAENDQHFHDERVSQLLDSTSKQDGFQTKLPSQCTAYGPCLGLGWYCSGSKNDCESIGMKAIGFVKSCGFNTCKSGYMVQCATCAATFASVKAPAPSALPATWVTPAPAPAAKSSSSATPVTATLPKPMSVLPSAVYNASAVSAAYAALKKAKAAMKPAMAKLKAARLKQEAIAQNITKCINDEAAAKTAFLADRQSAVEFARKRALANVTVFRIQKELADFYYIQKGAEQAAQLHLVNAENENKKYVYYAKKAVDLKYAAKDAQKLYEIGRATVRKARSDLDHAHSLASAEASYERSENNFQKQVAMSGVSTAKKMAVKMEAEKAFVASSSGRNISNVPP